VLDDFGRQGRAWRETDVERTDLETVIADLMSGQYNNPVTVVAFNLAERWAGDVSEDIAIEIQMRADRLQSAHPALWNLAAEQGGQAAFQT
jgi:hypothetical protein